MPLPRNGTEWPPADPHLDAMREWSAWYSGDPDQLSAFYGGQSANVATDRPAQYRGGVAGKLARWWWGQPTPQGEQRAKLHVPLAADLAGTSADLLFSEQLALTAGEDKRSQRWLDELQELGLDTTLHEGGEVQAALGGVYLRATWDTDTSDMPWSDPVHPDGAMPEFRHGRLRAVNLWTELPAIDTATVYRLVERHERGAILYRLYAGTATNLGRQVPLPEHPDAEDLADLVNEDGAQLTGVDRLLVTYVPNMLPNRKLRHSQQGRSDYQGLEGWMDALDEAYSSWWRDIRHAKARIHAPAQYLDSEGPGSAGRLDLDAEVYVPLDGVMGKPGDGLMLQAQQFAIRTQDHLDTCKAWTDRIVESAGYSTQSLSSGTGGAVTAAEVRAHERRSYMTRGKKARYWTRALQEHLRTMAELSNATRGLRPAGRLEDLGVEFPDGVQESTLQLASTAQAMRNAEAASTRTVVSMLHPDWDGDQVDEEVARIAGESGVPLPSPDDAGL